MSKEKDSGRCPFLFVPVQSQASFQLQGRTQAPVVAFIVLPAFAFGPYDLDLRSKCAKRTGQFLLFFGQIHTISGEIDDLRSAPGS
jgi:hypothetical protein